MFWRTTATIIGLLVIISSIWLIVEYICSGYADPVDPISWTLCKQISSTFVFKAQTVVEKLHFYPTFSIEHCDQCDLAMGQFDSE